VEELLSSRVVAIPKVLLPEAVEPEPEYVPEPALVLQPPEPEPEPQRDPVVILQEPLREPKIVLAEQKSEPKPVESRITVKQKPRSDSIGEMLRAARLERGDDLYLIADYLRIKPAFLIALENSRYDEFPADAYIIGFLRTYANFLGVDGKDAIDRYRYEMAGRRKKPILSMPTPVSEGRAPSGILMVGATVAILLIYALWYGFSSANRTAVHIQPPLPTASVAVPTVSATDSSAAAGLTAPLASAPQVAAPETPVASATPIASTMPVIPPASPGIMVTAEKPPSAPVAKEVGAPAKPEKDAKSTDDKKPQVYGDPAVPSRILIRATDSSWIMVTDDSGKTIFDHVLKPGETYKVPSKSGLSLTTGNGNGIVLTLDGNALPKVATGAPHMVRNISLDPDRLTVDPATSDR
jgi:cytoskeletal protein RodZ